MPPGVTKAGAGPAVLQAAAVLQAPLPEEPEKEVSTTKTESASGATKSGDQDKKVSQNQIDTSQSTTGPHRASKQEITNRKAEMSASGTSQKAALDEKFKNSSKTPQQQKKASKQESGSLWETMKKTAHAVAVDSFNKTARAVDSATAQAAKPDDETGLKRGEKISAKVSTKSDGFLYEFERPLTKEQAGAIIFQDGKVPEHARLEGSEKGWAVKIPNSAEARQNTIARFNKREETIKIIDRKPTDVYQPDPQITNTWTGGDLSTTGPRTAAAERRLDLKNDMGFTINNKYGLDQGQRHYEKVGLPGMGYEVAFDKPMTKAQVMVKLFDKEKVDKGGEIRLIPKSKEPASEWKVELIGIDAATAFKTEPGHAFSKVGRAFSDANLHQRESLPSETPPGIRTHIENRTIPPNAEKLKQPAKDGKDVYVWEQDGYMMYVKTNNKGKDGYYEAEAPTKMPEEKQGQIWMREYVKERGMAPREAWLTFVQDTADVSRGQWGMISGAARAPQVLRTGKPKSSFDNSPPPSRGTPSRTSAHANTSKGGPSQMPDAPAKPQHQSKSIYYDEQGVPVEVVNLSNKQGKSDVESAPNQAGGNKMKTGTEITQTGAKPKTPIEELKDLEKKGKFTGDASGLDKRLRSKDSEVRTRAEKELEEIKHEIKQGKKPNIEDYEYDNRSDRSGREKISDSFQKAELRDSGWLKNELGRSPEYRDRFMKWLEKGHIGRGHPHLNPGSREAREVLERFRAEENVHGKLDD